MMVNGEPVVPVSKRSAADDARQRCASRVYDALMGNPALHLEHQLAHELTLACERSANASLPPGVTLSKALLHNYMANAARQASKVSSIVELPYVAQDVALLAAALPAAVAAAQAHATKAAPIAATTTIAAAGGPAGTSTVAPSGASVGAKEALASCLSALSALSKLKVTPTLLEQSGAGKKVRAVAKAHASSLPQVTAAAEQVVAAWKAQLVGIAAGKKAS